VTKLSSDFLLFDKFFLFSWYFDPVAIEQAWHDFFCASLTDLNSWCSQTVTLEAANN